MEEDGLTEVSSEGLDLLRKMLEKNPDMRPSATECLRHPWFEEPQRISNMSAPPGSVLRISN